MSGLLANNRQSKTVTCIDVVSDYGATLEQLALAGPQLHSIDELPYEYPLIETALLTVAQRRDPRVQEDVLKAGYVELSAFRNGPSGVSAARTTVSPKDQQEAADWMQDLKTYAEEAELIVQEAARRTTEWEQRLLAMRNAADA